MKKKPPKKSESAPEYDPMREHNVLLDRVNKTVELIAEQHGSIVTKLEEHDRLFEKIDTKIERIGIKLGEHDKRFDRVESAIIENSKDIQLLKATTKRIEEKLDTVTTDHEQRIQKLETVH